MFTPEESAWLENNHIYKYWSRQTLSGITVSSLVTAIKGITEPNIENLVLLKYLYSLLEVVATDSDGYSQRVVKGPVKSPDAQLQTRQVAAAGNTDVLSSGQWADVVIFTRAGATATITGAISTTEIPQSTVIYLPNCQGTINVASAGAITDVYVMNWDFLSKEGN